MKKTEIEKMVLGVAAVAGAGLLLAKVAEVIFKRKQAKKKKILFVVTSHGELGHMGEHTGYYLSEVSHPWKILTKAGYEIDFVSPEGGTPPVDGFDLKDPINRKFWKNQKYQEKIIDSMLPEEVDPKEYCAVFYAGGHGAMWDFPESARLADIARRVYESGGVVAAVCHGPAGLLHVRLRNGKTLIEDRKVTGFTNEEEKIVKKEHVVPFLLENRLREQGALYEKSAPFMPYVVVDRRVITGQNPMSAGKVGKEILKELKAIKLKKKHGSK